MLLGCSTLHLPVLKQLQEIFPKIAGVLRGNNPATIHDIVSFGWVLTERFPGEKRGKRRIVISGDTQPGQPIIDAAKEADLLVHEATYPHKHANKAYTRQHSTVTEAANLAIKDE